MRRVLMGLWLVSLVIAAGCQPASKPPMAAPDSGSAASNPPAPQATTPPEPAAPAFRTLDTTAESELKQAFAFDKSDAERKAAREKYKDQRWRFHGRVTGRSDATLVIQAEDLREPLLVAMESKAAADRAVLHQDYLFEAMADDFFVRTFRNGTADADPDGPSAAEKTTDPRKHFRYTNTSGKTFYAGLTSQGSFEQSNDDVWIEKWTTGGHQEWWEIRRTPEYIELSRPDGAVHFRLGDQSALIRFGKAEWESAFTGQWQPKQTP